MAHQITVGGVGYNIIKGRILVGGVGYDIVKGRDKTGGSGYDIKFDNWLADFVELMGHATLGQSLGRNNSSTGSVGSWSTPGSNTYWFAFCDGEFSVSKYADGSLTNLYHSDSNKAWTRLNNGVFLSNDGGASGASVYGGTINSFTFTGYTEAEIDTILSSLDKVASAGRNASSQDYVQLAVDAGETILAACGNYMALHSPVGTLIYAPTVYGTDLSLIEYADGVAKLSSNGSTANKVYGGSIIRLG